jgi:Domain of unknown function (DUF6919)
MPDEHGRDEQHRLLWGQARTLADIGELTAQWLEGRITYRTYLRTWAPLLIRRPRHWSQSWPR